MPIPILLTIFIASIAGGSDDVHAQSPDDNWTLPTNLSNSGGTTAPAHAIDSDGNIHVIWQDYYRGTVYTYYDGTQWSDPQTKFFPFSSPALGAQPEEADSTGSVTMFITDPSGLVHAFWADTENQLYHSFVPSGRFGDSGAWSRAAKIAESAIDFDFIIGNDGRLHLTYVRETESAEFPAGIYYRYTDNGGTNWSIPEPIYVSPYFRSLTSSEANVDISLQDGQNGVSPIVSWDNRSRKQVLIASSNDDGESWSEPELVDSPTEENPGARPINISTTAYEGGLMRFWQDGDPDISCIQYYQVSTDGGSTWSERQRMLENLSGCPQEIYLFNSRGLLVMMVTIQGQVYLMAWDGTRWSNPQLQSELLGFEDPDTLDQVIFDCRRPGQDSAGNLVVVGCDTGAGSDIWITQKSIDDTNQWFPPPSAWTDPEQITAEDSTITHPILLADSQGQLHAFWVQKELRAETSSSSSLARDAIYYSRKNANQWTTPTAVLQSPSGMTRQPSAAIDSSDNLFVVWSGGESGEIYFSRASGNRANNPAEWVEPALLPSVRQAGSSPDIEILDNGNIYVAYAIPLNENRGVYVINSSDGGVTWSEPFLALDAIREDWEMVDQPNVAVTEDGSIQLTMAWFSLPGGSGSKGLYAMESGDGQGNWSDLETLTESPVRWNEVLSSADGSLIRAWLESSVGGDFFQYQVSNDQGKTWTPAASISTIGEIVSSPALTNEISGQAYLLLPVLDPAQGLLIRNWHWDGSGWTQEDALILREKNVSELSSLNAVISPSGRLSAAYSASVVDSSTQTEHNIIDFSDREIDLPILLTTPSAQSTLQAISSSQTEPTLLPIGTPTGMPPTQIPFEKNEVSINTGNTWIGLTMGVIIAGLLAAFAFTFGYFRLKSRS